MGSKRSKILAGVMVLFVLAGVAWVGIRSGPFSFLPGGGSSTPVATLPPLPDNPIAQENAKSGTLSWEITKDRRSTTQIQAYASQTSVSPGQTLSFYVSTSGDGMLPNLSKYRIEFYRLGWYNSTGGRLMDSTSYFPGAAQGYYNPRTMTLIDCATCVGPNSQNPMGPPVEANWKATNTYKIPNDWVSGVYLAKFITVNGWQTYTTFTLTNPNSKSAYIAVTPDTTYAAYNDWGSTSKFSASLYNLSANGSVGVEGANALAFAAREAKVSFNKPYPSGTGGDGASQVLFWELQSIKWMERQNYDISYISDVDMQVTPGHLLNHKAYISLGHDEYWTKEMRDQVEAARDHGVGLLFMGANASYWQMRFENNNRWVVSYKVEVDHHDYNRDPLYGVDNTRVTTFWRDPLINRPENALIGIMFDDLVHNVQGTQVEGYPWRASNTNSVLFKGSNLQAGQIYGCGIVGYEWDATFDNGHAPAGLQIIAQSDTIQDTTGYSDSDKRHGNTSYYIANSGALVFASGSIYWASALDNYRYQPDVACGPKLRAPVGLPTPAPIPIPGMSAQNLAVPGIQILMKNVMDQLVQKHTPGSGL